MERNVMDRDLTCVLFPGIVINDDKALQCLGGIRNISQVCSQPKKKRLGLSFQPDNPYSKRVFGDLQSTPGVLLKVKVKKKKVNNEIRREVMSTEVLGRVNKIYKFESMADFQYLPVHTEGAGQPKCIVNQIVPSGLDQFSFLSEPAPQYIPPGNFTRSDKPIHYAYTDKRYGEKREEPTSDGEGDIIHRRIRSERGKPLNQYEFNLNDDLPLEPHDFYLKQKQIRAVNYPAIEEEFKVITKLFEERPIWSQNLVKYHTKIKLNSCKVILPCVAIYMKSGPWRTLWVRYGYDPRKQPGARIYQTLDFRLRHHAGVHSMVMTRDQVVNYKNVDRVRYNKSISDQYMPDEVSEGAVYFRPGMAPTQRQIYYQYCDIEIPEVQEIISMEPPPGYLCHPKRGWLPPNTDNTCRDHIFRYVKEALLASHSAELNIEQGGSSEDGSSDEGASYSDAASNPNT